MDQSCAINPTNYDNQIAESQCEYLGKETAGRDEQRSHQVEFIVHTCQRLYVYHKRFHIVRKRRSHRECFYV